MLRLRLKTILSALTILLSLGITLGIGLSAHAFLDLEREMIDKLETKKFISPTEIYASPLEIRSGSSMNLAAASNLLNSNGYRSRNYSQTLLTLDFKELNSAQCQEDWGIAADNCLEAKSPASEDLLFVFKPTDTLVQIYKNQQKIESFSFQPKLIAQYIGITPVLHEIANLSEIPIQCSNAVMAIEDQQFLNHSGISIKGIMRAVSRNLIEGRKAQGASTITQQLVKNYFLTSEKTYSRKAREIAMALMLETRFTKDQILETYLNVIYMGQSGAYQVKGFKAAAKHYFNKDLKSLSLSECSLLAAIINSPGMYNPFKNPDKAKLRRSLVLKKMSELKLISELQRQTADNSSLPQKMPALASETAPYYIEAVRKQVSTLGIPWDGLKIYSGLNLQAQAWAQDSLIEKLERLDSENALIKKNREKGLILQGVVLSGDAKNGLIEVVVGGRNYKNTQFNRATEARRQVGSTIKPFVYLTAFAQGKTSDTLIEDAPFTYKWQKQSWTPENYDMKHRGSVSLAEALIQSLNIPTAKLGLEVGLDQVIKTANFFGLESPMTPVPSLTLGAFEMSQVQVLRAYMGLAAKGQVPSISFIRNIQDSKGSPLWTYIPTPRVFESPEAVQTTTEIMHQSTLSGTAAAIDKSGFPHYSAGKTGTTSDYKDAWFVGFSYETTTLVWMGYDNNTPHRLTGAGGPLPVWLSFMNKRLPTPKKTVDAL